ncbi:MAG: hypothetical protein WCI17_00785 [bacterium]
MTPKKLLLISGPSGGGKSTLIDQLRNGTLDPAIRALLPAPCAGWPVVEANDVVKGDLSAGDFAGIVRAGECLVHYDMVFIRRRKILRYEDDPAIRLLAQAASLDVVFIRPDVAQLQEQFVRRQQRHHTTKSKGSLLWRQFVRRPLRRVAAWLTDKPVIATEDWYVRDQGLADCYGPWETFIRTWAAKHSAIKIIRVEPASSPGEPARFRLAANTGEADGSRPMPTPEDTRIRKWGLPQIRFADLVRDKLVLVALARGKMTADCLRENGARDVLLLEKSGSVTAIREGMWVRKRYRRISDVRKNNCNVAILHGTAAFALMEKREFARFRYVLVPIGPAMVAMAIGLLMYGRRKALVLAGRTELQCNGRGRQYIVLNAHVQLRDQTRQYGPAGLAPLELLQRLAGVDYVLLRGSESMATGEHQGDIDILVSQDGMQEFKKRFSEEVGTYSFDVYTDDGQGGHAYKSVPYFTPKLARAIMQTACTSETGIRIASPQWRYLAYCYHLMFHDKILTASPQAPEIGAESFSKPHYHQELIRLAKCAGEPVPRTFDDIEQRLREADVFPSIDLIGFYSNRNAFLKKRYFDHVPMKVGLATFFVRDFGNGLEVLPELRERLKAKFEILAEGPVSEANRAQVIKGVRGGNWADAKAPGGRAEPVYWFVCWDPAPRPPSARTRRKHPRVDNENIRLKDELRRDLSPAEKTLRVVHSSDNSQEALDHVRHLGLTDHPGIAGHLAAGRT